MKLVRGFQFGPFKPWRLVPVISKAGRISEVAVGHHERRFGQSGWTLKKLFDYNMENMVHLSERPFQILGIFCLFFAFLFGTRLLIETLFPIQILPRVTTGLLLNVLIIGILSIISILATTGEFIIRNFIKLENHPSFIVREMLTRKCDVKK